MSFGGAGGMKLPKQQTVEEPQVITEDEEEVKRRAKIASANMGRSENILAGLQNILKRKLGE
jgi:hypothetical protein